MPIDPAIIARLSRRELHLAIGGTLDGQWIDDPVKPESELDGAAGKTVGREQWRVVQFRLGRAIDRHVWVLRGMTEAQAFDRLLAVYAMAGASRLP